MIILGVILTVFCGMFTLIMVFSEKYTKGLVVLTLLTILGIGLWAYDVSSFVEVTETTFVTNEPNRYDINVDKKAETLVTIREVKKEATRIGAIHNDETNYYLILEETK